MDHLGLPIAFGKPQPQARDESKPTRGGSSSRGDRGVVGGGKKNRGRGAASTESRPIEWPRAENLASQYDAFNGGAGSSGGGAGFNGGVKVSSSRSGGANERETVDHISHDKRKEGEAGDEVEAHLGAEVDMRGQVDTGNRERQIYSMGDT